MTNLHRPFNPGFLWSKVMKSVIFWNKHTKTRDYLSVYQTPTLVPLLMKGKKAETSSETISLFISNSAQFRRCYVTTSVGLGGSAI